MRMRNTKDGSSEVLGPGHIRFTSGLTTFPFVCLLQIATTKGCNATSLCHDSRNEALGGLFIMSWAYGEARR